MRYSMKLLPLIAASAAAHSWVEQMYVLDANGNYIGEPGYPRGFIDRSAGGDKMTVRFPPDGSGREKLIESDLTCRDDQSAPAKQNPQYLPLNAKAGDYVAMRYLENGHVSLPTTQEGKPGSGGLVYVYATSKNTLNPPLLDIMKWTPDSPLETGRLLAIQNYDDGRCHQMNSGVIANQRAKVDENNGEVACETDIQLPKDASSDLTLYWVWQWPTIEGTYNDGKSQVKNKDELYTTCMDVKIGSANQGKASATNAASTGAKYKLPVGQVIQDAPSNFKQRAANLTFPTNKAFYGPTNLSAAAASPAAGSSPAAASAAPAKPPVGSPAGSAAGSAPKASAAPYAEGAPAQGVPAPLTVTVTKTVTMPAVGAPTPGVDATAVYSPAPAVDSPAPAAAAPTGGVPAAGSPSEYIGKTAGASAARHTFRPFGHGKGGDSPAKRGWQGPEGVARPWRA